jgi:putative NIF3 family GTP cyclohydrolase 1 type 2
MKHRHISRRRFAVMAGAAGVVPLGIAPRDVSGAEPLTAEAVVRRIQTALGGEWPSPGPDGLKAGDPSTLVRGIATTAMATMDVLKRAVQANSNLILTYEPTFYSRTETGTDSGTGSGNSTVSGADPVVKGKREFIEKNGLVVFRLCDHWQARKENDMVTGLAGALGWSSRAVRNQANGGGLYEIPAATIQQTVALIRGKLNLRGGLRVVGDRKATIRRVLLFPGALTPTAMWQRYSEADMIVAGEVREWESTHYAADLFTVGEKRALVTTGRVVSEDPGMRLCADWLKSIVKEVSAQWIGVGDPYWRPA